LKKSRIVIVSCPFWSTGNPLAQLGCVADLSVMPTYWLSSILSGHSSDVRALCALPPSAASASAGTLASGGRDNLARLWRTKPEDKDLTWAEERIFEKHDRYVTSVAAAAPSSKFPEGLIFTGTVGGTLRAFSPSSSAPLAEINEAHASCISALFVSPATGTLVSGSWDCSAKVWLGEQLKCVMTLSGHEASVWSVIVLPDSGVIVTASADCSLRTWMAGQCKHTIEKAHGQAIRNVSIVDSNSFLSASNDGDVKLWRVETPSAKVQQVQTFSAHSHFIYSLAVLDSQSFAIGGEESGVKIFEGGEERQTLPVPAISIWAVVRLTNGDVAAGSSDGKIWIFTPHEERKAGADLVALYESELAKHKKPAKTQLEGVDVDQLPGKQALLAPGTKDGQTKMVKEGDTIEIHSWSASANKWTKIGDVVGQPGKDDGHKGGKVTFEGKEYDYVWDVELDDTGGKLKLPYNRSEDAWMAAQKFIHKHELPQDNLATVASFITTNSGGAPTSGGSGGSADPFTGAGAYTSNGGGSSYTGSVGGGVDPFTGGGAYTTQGGGSGGLASAAGPSPNPFFPQREYLTFAAMPKFEAMTKKLKEFNEQVEPELKLEETALEKFALICQSGKRTHIFHRETCLRPPSCSSEVENTAEDLIAVLRAASWPGERAFPALDTMRLAVLKPSAASLLLTEGNGDNTLTLMVKNMAPSSPDACLMLALRCLCNIFRSDVGRTLLRERQDELLSTLSAVMPKENKNVQVAMATLMINLSVAAVEAADSPGGQQLLTALCTLFLASTKDPEARFRVLVGMGTLLAAAGQSGKSAASELGARASVELWRTDAATAQHPAKVADCASAILNYL